jgi:hypothetical protein|tara:strand:- start:22752 stop:23036 length:285 start_codon:yes stop_codon:yes gene_type:complete
MDKEIGLGDRVQDRISGMKGIVLAISDWLYGCKRLSVQPEKLIGGKSESQTFDEPQLKLIKKRVVSTPHNSPIKKKKNKRIHGDRTDIVQSNIN